MSIIKEKEQFIQSGAKSQEIAEQIDEIQSVVMSVIEENEQL